MTPSKLPDGPEITVTMTKRLTMELTADQVEAIILEWAKAHGFSHRAVVDAFSRATITETIQTSEPYEVTP